MVIINRRLFFYPFSGIVYIIVTEKLSALSPRRIYTDGLNIYPTLILLTQKKSILLRQQTPETIQVLMSKAGWAIKFMNLIYFIPPSSWHPTPLKVNVQQPVIFPDL